MLTLLTNMSRDALISQLQNGLVLLVLGMGTVFLFLTILIGTTKLMSAVCAKIAPAKQATPTRKSSPAAQAVTGAKDAEVAAAIAAAYARSKN